MKVLQYSAFRKHLILQFWFLLCIDTHIKPEIAVVLIYVVDSKDSFNETCLHLFQKAPSENNFKLARLPSTEATTQAPHSVGIPVSASVEEELQLFLVFCMHQCVTLSKILKVGGSCMQNLML